MLDGGAGGTGRGAGHGRLDFDRSNLAVESEVEWRFLVRTKGVRVRRRFPALRLLAWLTLLGGSLALAACGGGDDSDDDADESEAGSGGTTGGSAGSGALGGSAGLATGGSSAGSAVGGGGTGGSAGRGSGGGGGGASGAGGLGAGSAGQASTMLTPLAAVDDPSRISELTGCALAQAGTCLVESARSADEVCQRFSNDWPKQTAMGYTLPEDHCGPAALDAETEDDAVRRINLYRWLSGLAPVSANPEWNTHAAACATIQAHLDDIDHFPPATSTCYGQMGGDASSQSLLAIGPYTPADSIDHLIWDWGDRNQHVLGHRWWMLHPGLTEVGLGFSFPADGRRATCVRNSDGTFLDRPPDLEGVVTYPGYGRTPYELINRTGFAEPVVDALEWFVSMPDSVDPSTAVVRVYREGATAYEVVPVTFGPFLRDYTGLWIAPSADPVPPGGYIVLVHGTSLGDFGYRTELVRCDPGAPLACDEVAQDCGAPGYGCYAHGVPYCAKAGNLTEGALCKGDRPAECAAGLTCVENWHARDEFRCAAYCDEENVDAERGCGNVCPGSYVLVSDSLTSTTAGAYCEAGVGSPCDPLAPACPADQACYSWEPARCLVAGSLAAGAACVYSSDCAPGLGCIGAEGSDTRCERYCDLATTGEPGSCDTVCEGEAWTFDGFGLCMAP